MGYPETVKPLIVIIPADTLSDTATGVGAGEGLMLRLLEQIKSNF